LGSDPIFGAAPSERAAHSATLWASRMERPPSPKGRGLRALASEASLGEKGEGMSPIRGKLSPLPFPSKLAALAKMESPLPLGRGGARWVYDSISRQT
jgi:hypothetical protein